MRSSRRKRAIAVVGSRRDWSRLTSTLSIDPCAMSTMDVTSASRSRCASAPMSVHSVPSSPRATK